MREFEGLVNTDTLQLAAGRFIGKKKSTKTES